MIEMKYQNKREMKILDNGCYHGFEYYILSFGTHPCAYIKLNKSHKFFGCDYDDINLSCHGGVTYSENHLGNVKKIVPASDDVWVIGWDYCHDGDKFGDRNNGNEWTTAEIKQEVHNVIEQVE